MAVVLTAAMVAEATNGRLVSGDPSQTFAGVATDTRTISSGTLFVALRGDRFDAHAFLADAIRGGAAGVLVESVPDGLPQATVIQVGNTLVALQALARAVRRASGTRVVAITGSAGKTTTKEVTADLLTAGGLRVHRNRGNLNNHIGLPLSLIELTGGFDVAVVELGMNHAGEIRTLVSIAEPDIRVWTNVGDAHVGHFGSREAVADAKAEILEAAGPSAVVVANADDALVMARVGRSRVRRVTFGESAGADVRATRVTDRGFDGVAARVTTASDEVDVTVSLPGRANLSNVLAAIAVAAECGIRLPQIAPSLAALRPVARRGASYLLASGARVIDDSYNASPAALDAALSALAATPSRGRRVAVVGEMLELGASASPLHEACGRSAAKAGVQVLVAIGGEAADALVRGAVDAGLPVAGVHRFADSASAAKAIGQLVTDGDLVLVKGSRGTRTDLVVDQLMAVA
ncbi:MAG: UDP-N-acetylmuramoyl-tripeptide--D-alanyl-D-alanine ligase [Acidobacteria bacterium]|nr:UDP-N-acetylmuramoyl-tripeptide--D-alanyl-D-alanine ligase [Acidobacteriota bacterium]